MKNYLLTLITFLSACASERKYNERLDAYNGDDISEVIMSLGPPDTTFTLPNGMTAYTWIKHGATVSTVNNASIFTKRSISSVDNYCKTTLLVSKDQKIISHKIEGTCKSR